MKMVFDSVQIILCLPNYSSVCLQQGPCSTGWPQNTQVAKYSPELLPDPRASISQVLKLQAWTLHTSPITLRKYNLCCLCPHQNLSCDHCKLHTKYACFLLAMSISNKCKFEISYYSPQKHQFYYCYYLIQTTW